METTTTALISAAVAIMTAILSYKQGQKKAVADATQTAFEAYNFALESLRKEFEIRIDRLHQENNELRNKIEVLERAKK